MEGGPPADPTDRLKEEPQMDRIHWRPTLVGEIWVFDLTHRATSTKVPDRTVAGVAVVEEDGRIADSLYQVMAFETRLVDRFIRSAETRWLDQSLTPSRVTLLACREQHRANTGRTGP
jgi:hypothetical protein